MVIWLRVKWNQFFVYFKEIDEGKGIVWSGRQRTREWKGSDSRRWAVPIVLEYVRIIILWSSAQNSVVITLLFIYISVSSWSEFLSGFFLLFHYKLYLSALVKSPCHTDISPLYTLSWAKWNCPVDKRTAKTPLDSWLKVLPDRKLWYFLWS